MVETPRELELEMKRENVTDLLKSHDETWIVEFTSDW